MEKSYIIACKFEGMIDAGIVPGKKYPVENKLCTDSHYAVINERGNMLQIPKDDVGDHFGAGKKYHIETEGREVYTVKLGINNNPFWINKAAGIYVGSMDIGINNGDTEKKIHSSIHQSLKPGGDLYMALRNGFSGGGYVSAATDSRITAHDEAVKILDQYLPGYRKSDKGFKLTDSVEWIAKLNEGHSKDCMRYEKILEDLMEAFGMANVGELEAMASELQRSAAVITAIKKR